MNNGTFCGLQFKKMLLSAIMIMVVMTLTDTMSIILSARFFGDNAILRGWRREKLRHGDNFAACD